MRESNFTTQTLPASASITKQSDEYQWNLPKPNIYTYSAAISACARANQMESALEVFDSLKQDEVDSNSTGVERNTWVYNALLASLSSKPHRNKKDRTKTFEIALDLLQNMEDDANLRGMDTKPNTITYNTILATLSGGKASREIMKKSAITKDSFSGEKSNSQDASTNLALIDESLSSEVFLSEVEFNSAPTDSLDNYMTKEESIVQEIFCKMQQQNITKDAITYHNAILACRKSSDSAIRVLEEAFKDYQEPRANFSKELTNLINTVFFVCASRGDVTTMVDIFNRYFTFDETDQNKNEMKAYVKPDQTSYYLMIKGMCRAGEPNSALDFLYALTGIYDTPAQRIAEKYGIRIQAAVDMLEERHYFTVIENCIRYDNIQNAMEILKLMKTQARFSPSASSLTAIASTCGKKAVELASLEVKAARKQNPRRKVLFPYIDRTSSQSRANAALMLLDSIKSQQIPPNTMFSVVKAFAASGLWDKAFALLRKIHQLSLLEQQNLGNGKKLMVTRNAKPSNYLEILPKLHRYSLKICARDGDVSSALQIVDLIQNFTAELSCLESRNSDLGSKAIEKSPTISSLLLSCEKAPVNFTDTTVMEASTYELNYNIGMDGTDWKLLIIAASKSRNWKVCLGTLQFLRAHIEDTNPDKNNEDSMSTKETMLKKQYDGLCPALSAAVLCLEARKQYAWAIRVVDDWMKWSGRRPPKDALVSTCRSLAARGRGQEMKDLISRVMQVNGIMGSSDLTAESEHVDYGLSIYAYAVQILYKNGVYDFADEIYLDGVARGYLAWPLAEINERRIEIMESSDASTSDNDLVKKSPLQLDLHGMSLAIAHSAVRTALYKEVQRINSNDNLSPLDDQEWFKDVIIITGKGANSAQRFRPVLRPEVQRMLTEEFYPPLSTTSVPNNMGALQIPAKDVDLWLSYQRQQRGAYMLTLADMLKSVSGVSKLRQSLLKLRKGEISDENESKK